MSRRDWKSFSSCSAGFAFSYRLTSLSFSYIICMYFNQPAIPFSKSVSISFHSSASIHVCLEKNSNRPRPTIYLLKHLNAFYSLKCSQEKTNYTDGVRLGSNKIWRPLELYRDVLNATSKNSQPEQEVIQYSIYIKLLKAIWYILLSYSEAMCYLIIILNQVIRANFISLPLVILMFCWGALTVPKPTRTYWVITIAYVLIMLFLKNVFVMKVIPWNAKQELYDDNLFFPPGIIGITSTTRVVFNFIMLVVFFFHRVVLQKLGLWKPFTYRNSALIEDGDYFVREGKLTRLNRNDPRGPSTLAVKTFGVSMSDYFPRSVLASFIKYAENFRLFTQQSITPSSAQIPVDVYTPMFLCDLINLCLILFFYGDFNNDLERSGLIEFMQNNTVPISFIVTVLVLVFLMVIDRAIYRRKNRFAKLVFYFLQVISCHLYLFVLYPIVTKKKFRDTRVVQAFYVFKCLYFLFSAYQIRNGYPSLISFQFLWHGMTVFNRFAYKFYLLIPYFFELRVLLDWICSDSCLAVTDWFKMEEITSNMFDQRCGQDLDENWSEPAGTAKDRNKKYLVGGFLYVLLILTVIFPFLLFSLSGTVGVQTHPAKIKLQVSIGSSEPIFESYASQKSLKLLSKEDYKNLTTTFNSIPESEEIFENFHADDVVVVDWSPNSLTKWKVSPGSYAELIEDVFSDDDFAVRVEISYTHLGTGGQKVKRIFGQSAVVPPLPNPQRQNLINMLQSNISVDTAIWVPLSFPKFLLITKDGTPKPLPIMLEQGNYTYDPYNESSFLQDTDDDEDTPADPKILRNLVASLLVNEDGDKWQSGPEFYLVLTLLTDFLGGI
uniref:Piezo non-specific cation channel R-Ras-binding domain-containing protein n=1 Tax=Dendroctonus ponderosae TaxID=77166 RepID=A0AAR5PGD9_DENPD